MRNICPTFNVKFLVESSRQNLNDEANARCQHAQMHAEAEEACSQEPMCSYQRMNVCVERENDEPCGADCDVNLETQECVGNAEDAEGCKRCKPKQVFVGLHHKSNVCPEEYTAFDAVGKVLAQ